MPTQLTTLNQLLNQYGIATVFTALMALGVSGCSSDQVEQVAVVSAGEQIFTKNCKVCHAQGINGAPILGNQKMWSKRAPQGLEVLVEHASAGYGLMPAKGGNDNLTTEDIQVAVSFMLAALEK